MSMRARYGFLYEGFKGKFYYWYVFIFNIFLKYNFLKYN